jgi:hypothetical protein
VVVELRGDDVVLARELWGRGDARVGLPTMRPRAATAALVGDEAPVEIGRQQMVDEHEGATGKLARELIGAEDVCWWLPTETPCVAGAGDEGGSGKWIGGSRIDRGSGGKERRG